MEDLKATLMAVALGGVAIGGFWLARPTASNAVLRLVEQRALPVGGAGLDRDAAALFRFEMPNAVREAFEDNLTVVFRIVDRKGTIYPLSPMADPAYYGAFKLPIGYAQIPESPRLEVAVGQRSIASVDLKDLPPAHDFPLVATSDSPVRLVYRGDSWITVEPKSPIPPGERWRIMARRTRRAPDLRMLAELPSQSPRLTSDRLVIPFPNQAGLVELDVVRYRRKTISTVVRVSGMRMVERFGGTALIVDQARSIPNALGAKVLLPDQDMGPRRPLRHPDPRIATLSLSATSPWAQPPSEPSLLLRERPPEFEILSTWPKNLGLRELRIGGALRVSKAKDLGPLHQGPFEALVRVDFYKPYVVGRHKVVVPVQTAPPSPGSTANHHGSFSGL